MILLDTHALIWLAAGTSDLGSKALRAIEEQPERRMSAMVAWELAMLVDKRRIALESPLDAEGNATGWNGFGSSLLSIFCRRIQRRRPMPQPES